MPLCPTLSCVKKDNGFEGATVREGANIKRGCEMKNHGSKEGGEREERKVREPGGKSDFRQPENAAHLAMPNNCPQLSSLTSL